MRTLILTAVVSAVLTTLSLVAMGWTPQTHSPGDVKLENPRVRISQIDYAPNQPRPRYVRPADQMIAFLDDSRYQRIDSTTGAKQIRERKSGDVIWHNKGEDAPVLTNLGAKSYRTLVIEVK